MGKEKKYDVFLSSKREDYPLTSGVYDFLKSQGLRVFLACEELKKIGKAKYAEIIDEVLDSSVHMIVVASSLDYISSTWVKYEWSLFSNDLKSGYRDGNLLTILNESIKLEDLPGSLRHQQSFLFSNYKLEILDYLHVSEPKEEIASKPQVAQIQAADFLQILMKAAAELRSMKIYASDDVSTAFEKLREYNSKAKDIFDSIKPFIAKAERTRLEEQYEIADAKMGSVQIKLLSNPPEKLSPADIEVAREAAIMHTQLRHELSRVLDAEIAKLLGND